MGLFSFLRSLVGRPVGSRGDRTRSDLDRTARLHAEDRYDGPAEGEPQVELMLAEVMADARRRFRSNTSLRDAQAALRASEEELISARAAVTATPHDADAGWSADAKARAGREAARVAQARLEDAEQTREARLRESQAIEARVIDDIAISVEDGIQQPNQYLAALNHHRAGFGRPVLGLLGDETIRSIVRRAVSPMLGDDDQNDDD